MLEVKHFSIFHKMLLLLLDGKPQPVHHYLPVAAHSGENHHRNGAAIWRTRYGHV